MCSVISYERQWCYKVECVEFGVLIAMGMGVCLSPNVWNFTFLLLLPV